MKDTRLFALLILLALAAVFFATMSYWEKKSREDLLIKASEKNNAKLCLNGNQSQRSRHCPEIIREVTQQLESLRNQCAGAGDIEKIAIYFDGNQFRCNELSDLELKKDLLLRSIKR